MKTSRQIVIDTLEGKNKGRAARQLWTLPWASIYHDAELKAIQRDFPDDIIQIEVPLKEKSPLIKGNSTEIGTFTDDWGCTFENIAKYRSGNNVLDSSDMYNAVGSSYSKCHTFSECGTVSRRK